MTKLNNVVNYLVKKDLYSFINKVFNTVNPGTDYQSNWHIELISDYLNAVQNGQIKRLIINIPPRSLKSLCISVAWPAWLLGYDPTKRIMAASYSQALSVKHSLDCRVVVESNWYNKIFPDTVLSKAQNQKSKFLTTANGFRFATSVGGSATGEGGDYLIVDDPHNPAHINSPKLRNKVIDWFEQTFLTRLNDKTKGAVIIVMQRLHSEDLTAHLLRSSSHWEHLKIPNQSDETRKYIILNKSYTFTYGEAMHSKRDSIEVLKALEQEIGAHNYHAQYLQQPIEDKNSLLQLKDISFYDQIPDHFDFYIQSWDTAIKLSEQADYSVGICFGIIGNKYYLLSMDRAKYSYPELKIKVEQFAKRYKPKDIIIEDKASGQQLIQDLRFSNYNNIIAIKPRLDKITRFASVVTLFQAGRILLPSTAGFKNVIINEITSFPSSKNDDIIDSLSQFLNLMKERDRPRELIIRNI
ncbi:MAG: terminase [Rickettsiaceae bacterium]|nr:MAG: terminase [Rickettsiaceae bacterium]